MHFRLGIGRWWVQIGRAEPDPPSRDPYPVDHPTPQTIYAPEYVGFVRTPDPTE